VPLLDCGGVESRILQIAPSLKSRGIDLSIINLGKQGRIGLTLERKGVNIVNLNLPVRITKINTTIKLWQFLREKDFDLMHTFVAEANWHGGVVARFLSKPLIIDEVGVPVNRSFLSNILLGMVYRRAVRVLVRSQALLDWLVCNKYTNRERIEIMPYFIDSLRFKFIDRVALSSLGRDYTTISCIGRLSPEKGQNVLLDSVPLVLRKHKNIRVQIVGDGPSNNKLQEQARKLGLLKEVEFLGYRDDVASILADTDIYVSPSFTEDISSSILEAMSSGCACIATAVGGTPSIITSPDLGILVKSGEPGALAEAICALLDNPKRLREIGFNASINSKKFGIENYIEKLLEIYKLPKRRGN